MLLLLPLLLLHLHHLLHYMRRRPLKTGKLKGWPPTFRPQEDGARRRAPNNRPAGQLSSVVGRPVMGSGGGARHPAAGRQPWEPISLALASSFVRSLPNQRHESRAKQGSLARTWRLISFHHHGQLNGESASAGAGPMMTCRARKNLSPLELVLVALRALTLALVPLRISRRRRRRRGRRRKGGKNFACVAWPRAVRRRRRPKRPCWPVGPPMDRQPSLFG